jgi:hypothetical protein
MESRLDHDFRSVRIYTTRLAAEAAHAVRARAFTDGQPASAPGGSGGSSRNRDPAFKRVNPNDAQAAKQLADLSIQLGIPLPKGRVLEAPWIGRIRGLFSKNKGKTRSIATSEGWLRDADKFWIVFDKLFPGDAKLMGKNRTVSPALAALYGWSQKFVGRKLVVHHIKNGPHAVALPAGVHKPEDLKIHAKVTIEAQ